MTNYPIIKHIQIKKSGIFDLDKVYKFVYAWLDEKNYYYHENLYKKKGVEMELEMEGLKKITGYTMFKINVEFQLWDMEDVEAIRHGKKVKLTKARIDIRLNATLVTDYKKDWTENKFQESLNKFYEKYIIKKNIEDVWMKELYLETYDLHEKIKKLMEQEASKNG